MVEGFALGCALPTATVRNCRQPRKTTAMCNGGTTHAKMHQWGAGKHKQTTVRYERPRTRGASVCGRKIPQIKKHLQRVPSTTNQ